MADLAYVLASLVFFAVAWGYALACERLQEAAAVDVELWTGAALALLLAIYLVYALLRPERF